MELIQIAEKFALVGKVISVEPYGEGHINRTYLVTTDKQRYIMQKINTALFTNVEALMNNIVAVTEFIKNKTESEGKEPNRYVVIVPANLEDPEAPAIPARTERREDRRGGRRDDRRGDGRRNGGRGGRGFDRKPMNRDRRPSGGNGGGTSMKKSSDFFGTFLGNSKKN
jgi:hypothetical protein